MFFTRLSHVPGELVAISPANGQRRRLTRNRTHELEPSWSPDGGGLAFVRVVGRGPTRTQEICVMRADGSRLRRLTRGKIDSQPTWSPDGSRIVFTRQTGRETAALYLVPAAGGKLKRLALLTTGHPAWAPGRLIAVDGIELMGPTGEPAGRATHPTELMRDSQLDWAPDGRRFVFLRYEDLQCRQCEIEYLATGELGNSAVRPIETTFGEFVSPTWSPDGRRIAAVTAESGRLVTMRPDGTDRRVVAGNLGGESPEIDWGPGPN
jgi:TolB protein